MGYLTQDPDLDPDRSLRDEAAGAFEHLRKLHKQIEEVSHQMAAAEGDELNKLLKRYEKIENKIEVAGGVFRRPSDRCDTPRTGLNR